MDLAQKIYNYCERGGDPTFWAEPLNAATNAAFLIAATLAAVEFAQAPRGQDRTLESGPRSSNGAENRTQTETWPGFRRIWVGASHRVQNASQVSAAAAHGSSGPARGLAERTLIVLVFIIGVGSFLFHTYATRWASFADVAPIGVFMLAYFAYALRRFAGLHWVGVMFGVGLFILALRYTATIQCDTSRLLPITAAASNRCLNGTIAYAPALGALFAIGLVLALMRHRAAIYIASATALLLVSMTFRTLDLELCQQTRVAGRAIGTHFVWHVLNAAMLYVLLLAALRHGSCQQRKASA